jgi:Ferrous iron transport protein B
VAELALHRLTVALVGNPNCGKTALFNRLTGARQKVANYAGVTVERKVGTARLDAQHSVAQLQHQAQARPSLTWWWPCLTPPTCAWACAWCWSCAPNSRARAGRCWWL